MTKLLVVESSPRDDSSVSRNMTRRFLRTWRSAHPNGEVVERDLMETGLEFVGAPWIEAYFKPPEHHTPDMKDALSLSDELVGEILAADHIVIGTPVYNYNVPAALKAWIDYIVRKGITLGNGHGLVTGKKATVLLASGKTYTEGSPDRDRDIAHRYLRLILNYIGITDVTLVAGGNTKPVDLGEQTMDDFIAKLEDQIESAAA